MSSLSRFLKKLKEDEKSGRRTLRHGNPADGMEYNEIKHSYLVSKKIWQADIARTPQVIREIGLHVDVHGEAWAANNHNCMINYRSYRVHGRGR